MGTDPSFIRCAVPNTHKIPGVVEPGLIMHQYQCNGVLAGIAICRKGFPNKTIYPEFKQRYNILAANEVAKAKKDKDAAKAVLEKIALDPEKYRLGHTKVFFRAGILGYMEEVREDRIGQVLSYLQAQARGKSSRIVFKKLQEQKLALYACQRSIRNWQIGKHWLWWKLWLALKPNLKCTKFAQYKAEYEEKIAIAEKNIDNAIAECKQVTAQHEKFMNEKNELLEVMESGGSAVQDLVDKTNRVEAQKNDLQKQVDDLANRIRQEEDSKGAVSAQVSKMKQESDKVKNEIKEAENALAQCEDDKATKENQITTLKEELQQQDELLNKLQKEKKTIGDSRQRTEEEIQALEDRCNHMSKVKAKADVDKIKRRLEGDVKLTQ